MPALDTLIRLARDEVARESRALRQVSAAIADLEARIEGVRAAAEAELRTGAASPGDAASLAAYLSANRDRRRRLAAQLVDLERERDCQIDRLRARRLEQKRVEVLRERRAADALQAEREREQRELEDLIAARASRAR